MMKSDKIDLSQLYNKVAEGEKTNKKIDLSLIFADNPVRYMDECRLFVAHFNSIPNIFHKRGINCKKANKWFVENYKSEIVDFHFYTDYTNQNLKHHCSLFYILQDGFIIHFNFNSCSIELLFRETDFFKVEKLFDSLIKFKTRVRQKPEISLVIVKSSGLETISLNISKPKLSIKDNYNDDFMEIHQTILKRLSQENDKGLILLHGKPGTGKTNYIRYLISMLKKNVIFLPPNMASAITNPDLISILVENTNSIFVIEDAENIVLDRERNGTSAVSAILNISDGLLSDCLNIQIICSFNTDISKVDSALMRKGRLIAKYEFKELEIDKAQKLSDKLLFKKKIYKPMTLTEIYNQDEINFHQSKQRNAIGFIKNN